MCSVMQGPPSSGMHARCAPSPCFGPKYYTDSAPVQQPKVIGSGQKTELDMITELLKKLPMPEPTHAIVGGANLSNSFPGATFVEEQRIGQASHAGIRPPPGLSLCDACPQQGQVRSGPHKQFDLVHLGMKGVYGFSRAADDDQSSTNDDGEHDACMSLSSEDEVGCCSERSYGLQRSAYTFGQHTNFESLPCLPPKVNNVNVSAAAHGSQPKPGPRGLTTLMVRNVPVMYTQQLLLKEWKNDGIYDFLYLPRSSVGQTNLSFAFINFVSEAHALAFKEKWHKQRMARFTARKPLNISFADVQGLRANILQVTRKRVVSSEVPRNQPHIVVNGRCMEPHEALAMIEY